jgi:hypothetical protein
MGNHSGLDETGNEQSSGVPPGTQVKIPAYLGSLALILPVALLSPSIGERQEVVPDRAMFVDFSMRIGAWQGSPQPVEPQLISTLRFDDYLLADYAAPGGGPLTLYMAYYQSQRKGQSAHSPQSCIPGGGWEITSIKDRESARWMESLNRSIVY